MPHSDRPVVFTAQSKRYFYCRDAVAAFVFLRGAVPINPFRTFDFFLGDRVDRDDIRQANDVLLMRSDELWVFGRSLANGVLHEIHIAAEVGKPVRFFSIEDRPEQIEELHVDSLTFEDEVRHKTGGNREQLLGDLKRTLSVQIEQPPLHFG